ncbi:hypothetical protein N7G274_007587 [Stereocaulon virgatum]|uniref:Uncharacterized protein n=1 Tax=Stereocaulon virgatum TaxID=373712 RepID=A0ABR4A8R0_9LECA
MARNYDQNGDLNNLLKGAVSSPVQVGKLIGEVKGIGKVGTDIFFGTAQSIWPVLAAFIDPRSMDTASKCRLGSDVASLWQLVGKDPVEMYKLASALTTVRLEQIFHEMLHQNLG